MRRPGLRHLDTVRRDATICVPVSDMFHVCLECGAMIEDKEILQIYISQQIADEHSCRAVTPPKLSLPVLPRLLEAYVRVF